MFPSRIESSDEPTNMPVTSGVVGQSEDINRSGHGRRGVAEGKNWGYVEGKGRRITETLTMVPRIPRASGMKMIIECVGNQVEECGVNGWTCGTMERMHGPRDNSPFSRGFLKLQSFADSMYPHRKLSPDLDHVTF